MAAGVEERRTIGILTQDGEHVGSYRSQTGPRIDLRRNREMRTNLFGGCAHLLYAGSSRVRIKADVLHRASSDRDSPARYDVAARTVRDVPERRPRIRHELTARRRHGACEAGARDFSGPRTRRDYDLTSAVARSSRGRDDSGIATRIDHRNNVIDLSDKEALRNQLVQGFQQDHIVDRAVVGIEHRVKGVRESRLELVQLL